MGNDAISDRQSRPKAPRSAIPLSSVARLVGIFAAALALPALLIWCAQMTYAGQTRRQTKMQFLQIAQGLVGYADQVALIAHERSHPVPATGLSLENVPWGEGHLPFPVRRASTGEPRNWYLRNGEGEPLYSWRVELLPFLESVPKPWDASERWDAAGKRGFLKRVSFFSYESAVSSTGSQDGDQAFPEANALAITGPGTAWGDGKEPPMSLKDIPPNTILVVEVRASGIPWPAPGDFDIRTMPQTINAPDGKGISSRHAGGFHVIFADQQVWFLSDKVPFESLKKLFTVADAKKYDREKLLAPYVLDRDL